MRRRSLARTPQNSLRVWSQASPMPSHPSSESTYAVGYGSNSSATPPHKPPLAGYSRRQAIARALPPDADIRAECFAHTRLPDAYFDLTVGNVPSADVRLPDPATIRVGQA